MRGYAKAAMAIANTTQMNVTRIRKAMSIMGYKTR